MDEIAPNRFLIYNAQINSVLKSEGDVRGRVFELTSWRRDGLLARLRERNYHVRTIADRLAALPAPPPAPPIGGAGWRPLSSAIDHISHFDLIQLRWHPLTSQERAGALGVTIYDGWVLRRRKGRNPADYYLALKERGGGIGLRPLDETSALLTGIAQALDQDPRPLLAERSDGALLLPEVELPPPHRAVLELFARPSPAGALVDEATWPLAQELYGRLGIQLTIAE